MATVVSEMQKKTFGTVCGESGDVDQAAVKDWKSEQPMICDGYYEPSDILNADETGLIYRAARNQTFHTKGEDDGGDRQST